MFRNFTRTAWKNLKNNSFYSIISIVGLGLGIAICMLILLFSTYEFSFDKFHKNYKKNFYLTAKTKFGLDSINLPLMSASTAPLIYNNNSDIKKFCRIKRNQNFVLFQSASNSERHFMEKNFMYVRTPSDTDIKEARNNDKSSFEAACKSGAQSPYRK